ncbi:MAG: GNAT family N-acetyltransferase [Pseudomonadota bacterium]
MTAPFQIRRVQWQDYGSQCAEIRKQVFFNEVRYGYYATLDGHDSRCRHALALTEDGTAVGCGRLDENGEISRIAVLPAWRQQGIGTALLSELIAIARDSGASAVQCAVPVFSLDYYRSQGFEPIGAVTIEAEVPLQRMRLLLTPSATSVRDSQLG